ncbi:hypothetical protein BDN70DRAFT_872301 [Pholiota conissans]|uniref:DUF6534 domain-containing protein n=1 Tax=Pholiota conissans TaxID=109636 RepID=A0A9P5ZCC7_9AGAR|nr:hypothetical protein BDN70DRAFT_872301 [Pholiota conissans]
MASPLDSTFGVWLVAIWLQTLLQGCGLLQAWLYFHWYAKDSWGIKGMVIFLVLIETFQIITFFQITYFYLIDNFGNVPNLLVIYWQDSAQLFATYLSAFVVQLYFGYCIYVLNKKNKIVPAIVVILALTQIAAGLAQTILTVKIHLLTELEKTVPITTLEAASALCCDLVITSALLWNLRKHKGQIKSTNNLLNRLMINAINRGGLTALCAAVNMIVFISKPGTYYFFIGLLLSGKLYMNSALATLNSRQHIAAKAQSSAGSGREWNSIAMEGMSRGKDHTQQSGVHIVVDHQSQTDRDMDYKTSNFMDGMV